MDKRIMINFSYDFTEQSMALKKQIDSAILGYIYFVRRVWHRRRGALGLIQSIWRKKRRDSNDAYFAFMRKIISNHTA